MRSLLVATLLGLGIVGVAAPRAEASWLSRAIRIATGTDNPYQRGYYPGPYDQRGYYNDYRGQGRYATYPYGSSYAPRGYRDSYYTPPQYPYRSSYTPQYRGNYYAPPRYSQPYSPYRPRW